MSQRPSTLPPYLRRLRPWARFRYYRRAVGSRAAALCLLDEGLQRSRLRRVRVGGESVWIRTSTSDLQVAMCSLAQNEYEAIEWPARPLVVIDAGANIGTSALFFARRFPEATVYAIEPEAGNFEMLIRNTAHLARVVPVRAALSHASGELEILDKGNSHWGYTVSSVDGEANPTGQRVRALSVPDFLAEFDIDFIDVFKIDIEGAEYELLEASADWMPRTGLLAIELHGRLRRGVRRLFNLAVAEARSVTQIDDKQIVVTGHRRPESA